MKKLKLLDEVEAFIVESMRGMAEREYLVFWKKAPQEEIEAVRAFFQKLAEAKEAGGRGVIQDQAYA